MLVDKPQLPEAEILASSNQPSEIALWNQKGLRSIAKQKIIHF